MHKAQPIRFNNNFFKEPFENGGRKTLIVHHSWKNIKIKIKIKINDCIKKSRRLLVFTPLHPWAIFYNINFKKEKEKEKEREVGFDSSQWVEGPG